MRPHVGRARHRHEGAPLFRRLRPHAVVDPARRNRVRRQGHSAGRVLRHRRHDAGRGAGARRTRPRHVQAEDLEAGRGAVRRAGHELRHLPGADLRHRAGLGAAQPAPPPGGHRRNRLCRTGNHAGKFGKCTGPGSGGAAGIRAGDVVVKVGDTPVSTFEDMAAAVRKLHGTVPVVVQRDGTPITTYVDVTPTQRWVTDGQGGKPQPSTVGAIGVGGHLDRAHALQRAHRRARHLRLHRRSDRRGGQVAGRHPDQGRRAGARHRRRAARPARRR